MDFYSHFEGLKNSLYRELSGSRFSGFAWTPFIHYWFYSNEQQRYHNEKIRQTLGESIKQTEIDEYNKVRDQITPYSSYKACLIKESTLNGTKYDQIILKRKKDYFKHCLGFSLFTVFYLQLSRYWLVFSFTPYLLLKYHDKKFTPVEEYTNVLNYIKEVRGSQDLYDSNITNVKKKLESLRHLKINLENFDDTKKGVEETWMNLMNAYLKAADKN